MATADVTVMGAGVIGLSVAYACAKAGARVRVIDPGGVATGASGGIVGALAPHVPENWNAKKAFQLDSLLMAESFWREVAEHSGADPGYARLGRLQPLADAQAVALAQSRMEGAKTLWQGRADWRVIPAEGNWAPPCPSGQMIHDTLSARIHPRRATAALAQAVRALGGDIAQTGTLEGRVVWATGWAGLQALGDKHHRSVGNGVKGQAALLDHAVPEAPQLFIDGVHFVPHADGTLAIGSTNERDFTSPDTTDVQLDQLVEKARQLCPQIKDAAVLARWAGVRPRSRSRAPMMGAHPTRAGEFVANGGFKIGFGMAPKMGQVMAELVLNDIDTIPDDFRVERSL